jgi:hypothetical protein
MAFSIRSSRETLDHCELCQFWDAVSANGEEGLRSPKDIKYELHELWIDGSGTFTIQGTTGYYDGFFNTHWTQVCAEVSPNNRQWVREHIDWDWLRDWLRQLPEPGISDINFSLSEDLQDFRVIDVLSNCVIHIPPNSQYLALSYVWGSDSKDHIRCLSSNVSTLSQPGALRASNLPRTISDAILVCQNLGYRFLWADRLCIMQDDSPESLSKQLNQMANIYNRAALTLVAATGVSATHGLAGVSHARDARQKVCKYGKNFELTNPTPLLEDFLPESKWWTRGWTYQEYIASKRLLFFTNYGLRLQNNRTSDKIFAEGFSGIGRMQSPELDFDLIEGYTRKDLTHDSDILHASSGFLRALYGHRLSYGMPWDDFDRAILWTQNAFDRGLRASTNTEVFPTWSWISAMSPISIPRAKHPIFSLAYWGVLNTGAPTTIKVLSSKAAFQEHHFQEHYIVAALSWLYGCIDKEPPSWLSVDCTRVEYAERMKKQWSIPHSLSWQDDFQRNGQVFENIDRASLSNAASLMVYTQKTSFELDWRGQNLPNSGNPEPGFRPLLVRNNNNEIAGTFELSDYSAQRLQLLDQAHATFIALSTSTYEYDLIPNYISGYFRHLSVSAFYGCPCSMNDEGAHDDVQHSLECPEHADFRSIKPTCSRSGGATVVLEGPRIPTTSVPEKSEQDHDQAYSHHLARLSYHDINNELLHSRDHPPFLWAMLIAPREASDLQLKVYERIAIGQIYLKRWVESSPVFEALVLV